MPDNCGIMVDRSRAENPLTQRPSNKAGPNVAELSAVCRYPNGQIGNLSLQNGHDMTFIGQIDGNVLAAPRSR